LTRFAPEAGHLKVDLHGEIAGILALSQASKSPIRDPADGAEQLVMVAGARNQRYLHLDHAIL
jgi:hypothetical protein